MRLHPPSRSPKRGEGRASLGVRPPGASGGGCARCCLLAGGAARLPAAGTAVGVNWQPASAGRPRLQPPPSIAMPLQGPGASIAGLPHLQPLHWTAAAPAGPPGAGAGC